MQYRRLPRGYTPEAIANARRRYEETDEPQESIAADLGVHRKTLNRLARDQGWTLREDRPPRDLPSDLRLLVEAEQAVRVEAEAAIELRDGDNVSSSVDLSLTSPVSQLSVADRLERAVEKELAAVEMMRATLGPQPQPPADADRTVRTLERLTDTLFKVRRLRVPEAHMTGSNDYDDMPRDIDEFRRTLARRIEAFVRSQTDGAISEPGENLSAASTE